MFMKATSRLKGWAYIRSLMYECPECGQKPFLGNTVYTNKWQCACMNACCHNMNVTVHKNPFMAIHEWNMRYGKKEVSLNTDEILTNIL